eukprot:jgi/Ulvmu1/12709/UM095_0013.1
MQSHASRHAVSEFLRDRHPCHSGSHHNASAEVSCSQDVKVAYGRQGVPQILAGLQTPSARAAEGVAALSLVLATQEMKLEAIRFEAPRVLIQYLNPSFDPPVVKAACRNLAHLIRLIDGCRATVRNGGIEALVSALHVAPKEVALCILDLSRTPEGSQAILHSGADSTKALARVCKDPEVHVDVVEIIVSIWAMLARSDAGISAALAADFPSISIDLAKDAIKSAEYRISSVATCQRCSEFLRQLSHEDVGKVAIREAKGIPVLAQMLQCRDETTIANSVDALMGITIDPEGKVQTVQVAGKRLIELLKGVKDMPLHLQHGCRAVLLNAAEHPVARKLITLSLPKAEQDMFLGPLPALSHDYKVHAT